MSELILTNPKDMRVLISEVMEEKLNAFSFWFESKIIEQDKPLTREETVKYLDISFSTLNRWTNEGKIKSHGIGDRVYYKMSEIEKALKPIN